MGEEQGISQLPSQNFFEFLRNNSLLTDDSNDPDVFINENSATELLDTPIYEHPYAFHVEQGSLSIMSFNIRSISKNFDEFKIFLATCQNPFSIICLQETWAKDEVEENLTLKYPLPGYECYHIPREYDKRGGGICVYVKQGFDIQVKKDLSCSSQHIEMQVLEIIRPNLKNIFIGNVYRPPQGKFKNFNDVILKLIARTKNRPTFIVGDINLNILAYERDTKVRNFLQKMIQKSFLPSITKPTRITRKKETCIDNIFSNSSLDYKINSGVMQVKISDHFPIFITVNKMLNKTAKTSKLMKTTKRIYKTDQINNFQEQINAISWLSVTDKQDTNESFNEFTTQISKIYNQCFPIQTKYVKEKNILNKWMTSGLLKSSKQKQKLYKNLLKNKTVENENKYKKYAKEFNKLKEKAKINFYSNKVIANETNLKKLWSTMKEIISKNKPRKDYPKNITVNGKRLTDKKLISEEFNSFFTNVGPILASKIKNTDQNVLRYLKQSDTNFKITHVDQMELKCAFDKLKVNKAPGFDDYNARVIKNLYDTIKVPLLHIINLSFKTGIFPENMKIAKVLPLFKSGERSKMDNYRPISLLPLFSKILERIMHTRLYKHFESNKLFYGKQFGFRKNCGVDFGLMEVVDDISQAMANKKLTLGVFIDLSKAFDTVDHEILLQKMKIYGICGVELLWFKSYLTNRQQFVTIDDVISSLQYIKCGVPQGSILGPLLFLIYVNDMHLAVPKLNTVMFADDTNLFMCGSDYKKLFKDMNEQLSFIEDWFSVNKLSLNVDKTKYTLFCSKCMEEDLPLKLPKLNIGKNEVYRTRYTKFLGILIDENLTWDPQLKAIAAKISSQIGIICRGRKFLNNHAMKMLYFAFINPYLTYGNLVWGSVPKSKLNKINTLQKRAVRIVSHAPRGSHSRPLMIENKILNIYEINLFSFFKLMFKVYKNEVPDCIQGKLTKNGHRYPTRFSDATYKCDIFSINFRNKFSFPYRGPYIWNYLVVSNPIILEKVNPKSFVKNLLLSENAQIKIW